jgi:hypothetical protein
MIFEALFLACILGVALAAHPPAAAAANIAAANRMLSQTKSMLRRDDSTTSGLTTAQIVGISVGAGVFVIFSGWLIYKYKTWVPKTRAARAGAVSTPSSPSSADERKKLIVAK